jgi:cell division protease FtsH
VAAITVGFAGADLANLVNEAALVATRRNGDSVTLPDFTQAIERIVAGIEKKHRLLSEQERRTVAYHEMGHALAALALPGSDRVQKVSIVPRGMGALGYTLQRPTEDRHLMRRQELLDRLTVLLAGRAAELLVFGELSTGAADDIAKATALARDMVVHYGMDDVLGPVSYADVQRRYFGMPDGIGPPGATGFGADTAQRIDAAVLELVQEALDRARAILGCHRAVLDRCADALLARETLDADEIAALTGDLAVSSGTPAERRDRRPVTA